MTLAAGFVHHIDPVLLTIGSIPLMFVTLVLFCLVIPSSWTKGALKEMRNARADGSSNCSLRTVSDWFPG